MKPILRMAIPEQCEDQDTEETVHGPILDDIFIEDSFLKPTFSLECPRVVVIDVANILCATTGIFEPPLTPPPTRRPFGQGESVERPPNAVSADHWRRESAGLLSLVRFFVSNGFQPCCITPFKYMKRSNTRHSYILEKLDELQLLRVIEDHHYDDVIMLEIAKEYDGVIVTADQFRDHAAAEYATPRFRELIDTRRVIPAFNGSGIGVTLMPQPAFLPKEKWASYTSNGHWVADHTFGFCGSNESLRAQFFSTPKSKRHELVTFYHQAFTDRRRAKTMVELDTLVKRVSSKLRKRAIDVTGVKDRP